MASLAYMILQHCLIRGEQGGSVLARAVGADRKGKLSPVLYAVAIAAAAYRPWLSICVYVTTALIWLIPDRRIEETVTRDMRRAGRD